VGVRLLLLTALASILGIVLLTAPILQGPPPTGEALGVTAAGEGAGGVVTPLAEDPPLLSALRTPPPSPSPSPSTSPSTSPSPSPSPRPPPEPTPEPAPEPTPSPASAALTERIHRLVATTALPDGAALGIAVVDADEAPVFTTGADEALLPASTQKLFLAAAALRRLGPDFRFRTDVVAAGRVGDGLLDGDLVILGGADPALATPAFAAHVYADRPRTPMEALTDQIVAAGVARISGSVLGDASILPHEPEGPGWLPAYLSNGDATRSSGLAVDAGRRVFQQAGRWRSAPSEDPAADAAAALHELLTSRGVEIAGAPGRAASRPESGVPLASLESPPLVELLRHTVQHSDNHLADGIFRAIGRADGDGSWASGGHALHAALAPLDLDLAHAVFSGGSGLSRLDRTSAEAVVALDARMTRSSLGSQWRSLMAVNGRSGTLRRRLLGTVAEGRLLGKTGTLRDVRSLSGAVQGPDDARYHFAIVGNGLDRAGIQAVRALQDDVVLALAEDLYECAMVPVPTPSSEVSMRAAGTPTGDGFDVPTSTRIEREPERELICAR
jgi:serine-type D-Ala-D-Ala carboxypeptidase/endopeptidase (penicillin-binding protein 4)